MPKGELKDRKVFVGSLLETETDETLRTHFSQYGKIESSIVHADRETGRPKGSGFVIFSDSADALKAVQAANGAVRNGRKLGVRFAISGDAATAAGTASGLADTARHALAGKTGSTYSFEGAHALEEKDMTKFSDIEHANMMLKEGKISASLHAAMVSTLEKKVKAGTSDIDQADRLLKEGKITASVHAAMVSTLEKKVKKELSDLEQADLLLKEGKISASVHAAMVSTLEKEVKAGTSDIDQADRLLKEGKITASVHAAMVSTLEKKVKKELSDLEQADLLLKEGKITASVHAAMVSTLEKKGKKELSDLEQADLLLKEGKISASVHAVMVSALTAKIGPKEPARPGSAVKFFLSDGKIVSLNHDSNYGFINIGKKQMVHFKFDKCYSEPKVGDAVNVKWYENSKGLEAAEVTHDLGREEMICAAKEIYKLTDGAVTVDPSLLDRKGMADLLKSVKDLTVELRGKRDKAIQQHLKSLKLASTAQIAFLMDCTGSMGSYIEAAKSGIKSLRDSVLRAIPTGDIEFAFVGYRDFGDAPVPLLPFCSDTKVFESHLRAVSATGGADECEDVFGGLTTVAALEWKKQIGTRILFHIADAPTHGTYFSYGTAYSDSHGHFDSDGRQTKAVLEKIVDKHAVHYMFLKINERTNDMIRRYNELIQACMGSRAALPGHSVAVGKSEILTVKLSSAADIIQVAIASTVASMSKTFAEASSLVSSGSDGKRDSKAEHFSKILASIKTFSKEASARSADSRESAGRTMESSERHSRWADFGLGEIVEESVEELDSIEIGSTVPDHDGAQYVRVFSCKRPSCFEDLQTPLQLTAPKVRAFYIELDPKKLFGKGGVRNVSKATDVTKYSDSKPTSKGTALSSSASDSETSTREYVFKVHQKVTDLKMDEINTKDDLQSMTVAAFLAEEFCKEPSVGKTIKYLKSKAVIFKDLEGRQRFATIESILRGEFIKWSNNADYAKAEDDPDFSATLSAFTHWTYQKTDGYLMVVDVQGIKSPDKTEFVLTDPAIHCRNPDRFGGTNLGKAGMLLFFSKHRCNAMCNALSLKKHSACPGVCAIGTKPVT